MRLRLDKKASSEVLTDIAVSILWYLSKAERHDSRELLLPLALQDLARVTRLAVGMDLHQEISYCDRRR